MTAFFAGLFGGLVDVGNRLGRRTLAEMPFRRHPCHLQLVALRRPSCRPAIRSSGRPACGRSGCRRNPKSASGRTLRRISPDAAAIGAADGAAATVLHDVRRLVRHQPQVMLALTVAERDALAFGIGAGANGGGGGTRGRAGVDAHIGQRHRRSRAPVASARSRATAGRRTSGPSRSDGRPRRPRRQPGAVHRDWQRRCVRAGVCRPPVSLRTCPAPSDADAVSGATDTAGALPDRSPAAVLRCARRLAVPPGSTTPGAGVRRTRPDAPGSTTACGAAVARVSTERRTGGRRPCRDGGRQSLPRAGCERRLGRWPHASARDGHDHWPRDPRPSTGAARRT